MKKYHCLDCDKLLEQTTPGVITGWLRTDGDKNIIQCVPGGGVIVGNELGFVCNDCSIVGKETKQRRET